MFRVVEVGLLLIPFAFASRYRLNKSGSATDPTFEVQAHELRSEINIVAVSLWLLCLAAVVLPRKKGDEPEKASSTMIRRSLRIGGGIFLGVLSFTYLMSWDPVRHVVLHNSLVKTVLMPSFRARNTWLLHRVEPHLPPKGRILNFGAGGNTFSDLLATQGFDVVPLDIVDESIAETPVVVYDGMEIPESIGKFDAAVILTVLHHIPEQFIPHILDQLSKIAKKIVIFEDVATHSTYTSTAMFCVRENLQLFNHPLNFKSIEAWSQVFSKYNLVNVTETVTDMGNHFGTFVLQP